MPQLLPTLFAIVLFAATAARGIESSRENRSFSVAPTPAWVQPVVLAEMPEEPIAPDASLRYRLYSRQIRVGAETVEAYHRVVRHFTHPAGLEQGAEIEIHFAPSFERLTFHGVWLERAGKRTYVFDPGQVRVIQQERAHDERHYDGLLSAILFVADVRVGDSLEFAYTLEGRNPVFGANYFDSIEAGFSVPVDHWRIRLLWPNERALFIRAHGTELEPTVNEGPGQREYLWERENVAPIQADDQVPGWFSPLPWVSLSEFESWEKVVQWALPLYPVPMKSEGPLAAKVAELAKRKSPEERFIAALRFVQDEVRYLGIELGQNSKQPHAPGETLTRRFGDAKDKSLLLVTLLQTLGIEARVALVNARAAHQIAEWLPSPSAFDHVIVRARVGTRELWVDPTATLERGKIDQLVPPKFRKALVVDSETTSLTDIPFPELAEPELELEESYVATDRAAPVKLTVTTRHTGTSANRMRRHIAATPVAELSRELLNYYARSDPKIRVITPLKVRDDAETNTLTLTEQYTIEDFWKDGRRDLYGNEVARFLHKPRITQRSMPLALSHPVHVRQVIRLDPPDELQVESDSGTVKGLGAELAYIFRAAGRTVLLEFHYRSLTDSVAPRDIDTHLEAMDTMKDRLGYWVRLDSGVAALAAPSKDRGRPAFFLPVFLFVLLVLFTVASGAFRARKLPAPEAQNEKPRLTPLKLEPAPGETAATALVISSTEEQFLHLQQVRCACGTRGLGRETETIEIPLVLAGRKIIAVKWRCPTCSNDRTAYFTSDSERAAG